MPDLARFFQRNHHRFGAGPDVLMIDPPGEIVATLAADMQRCALFFQHFDAFQAAARMTKSVRFGTFPRGDEPCWREIVLTLPREKALLDAWLCWARGALSAEGCLWLMGENRAGARSAGGALKRIFTSVEKIDSARHCSLFRAFGLREPARFDEENLYHGWEFTVAERTYPVCSMPGVFAHGRLDAGTQLLLETVSAIPFAGSMLDFGSGAGVIAAVLLQRNPGLDATLCDNSALALAASQRTLKANGVTGRIVPSNGLAGIDGNFDTVISNPPFHRGVHTDSGMSMAMLSPVRNFLHARGQLIIVANRHLPYAGWMRDLFGGCETLAHNARFQVLRAEHR